MPVSLSKIEPHLTEVPAAPAASPAPTHPVHQNDDAMKVKARAMIYASRWEGVREHDGRNNAGMEHAADLLIDFALPEDEAREIWDNWNQKNMPPMVDPEASTVFKNGKTYGKHVYGCKRDRPAPQKTATTPTLAQEGQAPRQLHVINATTWLDTEPAAPDQILADTFDRADKVGIIGSSKLRKSFLLLQGMLSIASGRDFLSWVVPKPRRVVAVQFEIQAQHFHRRVRRMAKALGITAADLGDRLQIVNARGLGLCGAAGIKTILEAAKPFKPDLIAFDPLYKIATGVENAAEDLKVTLNLFDELAETLGVAVLYVHHDPKGAVGDRDIRDRGAGSNVLGRDYDACFVLTPHASEPDAAVVEILLRNYAPQEPRTIAWAEDLLTGGYKFNLRTDIAPTKRTTANSNNAETSFDAYQEIVSSLLETGPMEITGFKERLRNKTGMGRNRCDLYVRWALMKQPAPLDTHETRSRGKHIKWIGTPDQIAKKRVEQ